MSTEVDNKDLIEAKWKSLVRHVQNVHDGHGQPYSKCSHQPLSATVICETAWFTPDTEACDALEKIVLDKALIKDISNSSSFGQTSPVEGYHSLVNQLDLLHNLHRKYCVYTIFLISVHQLMIKSFHG